MTFVHLVLGTGGTRTVPSDTQPVRSAPADAPEQLLRSLKRRARSALPAAAVRLLNTGDGLGEKLSLTKSQMLLAPPTPDAIRLPNEFWEEELSVPRRPCSCLANMLEEWFCCDSVADSSDCDSDWEREPSGEVESDDDEWNDDDRAREPGMLTGAEPASNR
ncbi:hypothetical protein EYF80_010137 [Liparis tanakae]|uniref:Uncharacterized protein n=1 Tax=Liparis tanakae TaxID=230148 RepID=A0A4Z2INT5_9TELE|nr:hypothetical protein EYF80_010137 [Liparis tanakae]